MSTLEIFLGLTLIVITILLALALWSIHKPKPATPPNYWHKADNDTWDYYIDGEDDHVLTHVQPGVRMYLARIGPRGEHVFLTREAAMRAVENYYGR